MNCLDTYALVEIDKGNPRFASYADGDFVITGETLAEFYWVLMRDASQSVADHWYEKLLPYAVSVAPDLLVEAMRFRRKHKKRRISFFDAVGYVFARARNILFVTGDKEFEKLPHVDFRK